MDVFTMSKVIVLSKNRLKKLKSIIFQRILDWSNDVGLVSMPLFQDGVICQ